MIRRIATVVIGILALQLGVVATAQLATEVYIPIGKSPGISGEKSVIGTITGIDYENEQNRMTVAVDGAPRAVTMTPATRYYLDRSGERRRSVTGSVEDCREGQRVEAYVDDDGNAIWIKIVVN